MATAQGFAAPAKGVPLGPLTFTRRDLRPNDVQIDIIFCGVCHSDMHAARGEWDGSVFPEGTIYPCVPGHEIIGRVTAVGAEVSRHRAGDLVGVGTIVDICRTCEACGSGLKQLCETFPTMTYNSPDRVTGENTLGGYTDSIVVRDEFVLKVRHEERDLAAVAPLLCAGITMWSPLRHWEAGPGKKVGIVGIGRLGHMGIKLARAMGAHVVAFTTSELKRSDAFKLGAIEVVISRNPAEMAAQANRLDFIINTVAASHDLDPYLSLLKRDGTMVLVGAPAEPHPSPSITTLMFQRRRLSASMDGGITETQEMLDFCAQHSIVADIELIPIQQIETAFARILRRDVKYRFVIDMASLPSQV